MAATGPRRRRTASTATGPRPVPVLVTDGPGQVLCWDITWLPGAFRGVRWALYLIIDLFSRMIQGWTIQDREDHHTATDLMRAVIIDQNGRVRTVHSDNGAVMTSRMMKKLFTDHNIVQSLIRPGVSNDNAQSESLFRTVKYGPAWPGVFSDIDHATGWFADFVEDYNLRHHHTGLAGFTPASVYHGTWTTVARARQATLTAAWQAHPERYRRPPQVRHPPDTVTLNLASHGHTHTPPTLTQLLTN